MQILLTKLWAMPFLLQLTSFIADFCFLIKHSEVNLVKYHVCLEQSSSSRFLQRTLPDHNVENKVMATVFREASIPY